MASGVAVDDDVKKIFNEMKCLKHGDERLRFMVLHIDDKHIKVKETFTNKDLNGENAFNFFKGKLQDECCYILYDCHYENDDSPKDELILVMWCPDVGCAKDKMNYSASKGALKRILIGVKNWVELHDKEECSNEVEFACKLNKSMVSLEGIELCQKK